MANDQHLPSFCHSSSLEADPHTKRFNASATPIFMGSAYSDYGFVALLGLAQRLKIDLLPITWQALLGLVGRSRAEINQALVNIQTSFAFKHLEHANQSDALRETVQEMVVLGHPLVKDHPYIVQLLGICWDIPQEDQVWPVLVFEKSHLGDLYHFARLGKGRDLSFEARLKICVDIGIALKDMHLNKIIHGDVKPQNVLVFEDKPGIYTARVADFGFSTHFHGEENLVQMPESIPWSAPEHHHRYFCSQDAKTMDVYSFGMLCLWLLFGIEFSDTMPYPSESKDDTDTFSFEAQYWYKKGALLLSWKRNRLLGWAIQLATQDEDLGTQLENRLTEFFRSSLHFHPQMRVTDWSYLLRFLDPARDLRNTPIFSIDLIHEEDFQITTSLWGLYQSDFRVRSFIVTQLEAIVAKSITTTTFQHTSTAKAAQQLALCQVTGFGIPKNDLYESAIEDQIPRLKTLELQVFQEDGIVDRLHKAGFINAIRYPQYYQEYDLFAKAMEVYSREVRDTEEVFGESHWLTLLLKGQLGSMLKAEGKWKAAETLEVQVMETRKREFGEEDIDTLISMANLARTYNMLGRFEDAEAQEMQIIETKKRLLGIEHPDTLASLSNLALTYCHQERWKEAEELELQAIEMRRRVLGEDHLATLISMSILGYVYYGQGQWKKAEELQASITQSCKRTLGAEHPDTINSMDNLSQTYNKQGRWKEAKELVIQIINTRKRVLGEEHPSTLTVMGRLSVIYWKQGQLERAEELAEQVMKIKERVLGKKDPDTLMSMANLALIYRSRRRLREAEELQVKVVEARKEILGEKHPDTLVSIGGLAIIYGSQGLTTKAQELGLPLMEDFKRIFGEEHPTTLSGLASLIEIYLNEERWEEAEKLAVPLVNARERVLGPEHPDTLTSMVNLASTWKGRGRNSEALDLMRRCVQRCHHVLGADHPHYISSLNVLVVWEREANAITSTQHR